MGCNARRALLALGLCGGALLGGCRGGDQLDTAPVRGVVTFNGAPVSEGEVIFIPARGRPARAALNPDGSFVLGTYGSADGAIVGPHRVAVISRRGEPPEEWSDAGYEWLVPEQFANPNTSGLTFEVQADQANAARFDLSSHPTPSSAQP